MSSCTKEDQAPPVNNNFINTAPVPFTVDLITDHWDEIVTGVYTCTFLNVISPVYRHGTVKVYLLNEEQKIQINDPIIFMGGELSATTTAPDVKINYRHYGELPFNYLVVRIVIE